MSWVTQKYINLLSMRLEKFKRKSANLWNFRCPICGDSHTNKSKARGYIYQKKGEYVFHCHNCNDTKSFKNFLKLVDPVMYAEYNIELLKETASPTQPKPIDNFKMSAPVFKRVQDPLSSLKKISQLRDISNVKRYIVNRQIPTPYHAKLYFAPQFKSWVNSIIPDKFENVEYDEPRLVIPFKNVNGDMIGFQGRSFKAEDKLRYITIITDGTYPRLYGMDTVDLLDKIYVFEGPIDSMFISNGIASAGGDIIRELPKIDVDKSAYTVVYDNEPRNVETVGKMLHAAEAGYPVCVWPDTIRLKDINDMVKSEIADRSFINTEHINRITNRIRKTIDQNTYEGLAAKMKISQWRKC